MGIYKDHISPPDPITNRELKGILKIIGVHPYLSSRFEICPV
jgi:hypothetical protein